MAHDYPDSEAPIPKAGLGVLDVHFPSGYRSPEYFDRGMRIGDFVEATFENWESEFLQMGKWSSRRSCTSGVLRNRNPSTRRRPKTSTRAPHRLPMRHPGRSARAGGWDGSTSAPGNHRFLSCSWRRGHCTAREASQPSTTNNPNTTSRRYRWALRHHGPILVRIDAELAERTHRSGGHRRPVRLFTVARPARVQTRCRSPPRNECVTSSAHTRVLMVDKVFAGIGGLAQLAFGAVRTQRRQPLRPL